MTDYEEFGEPPLEAPAFGAALPPRRRRATETVASSAPAGHGARFAAAFIDLSLWFLPGFAVGFAVGVGVEGVEAEMMRWIGYGWMIVFLAQAVLLTVRSQSLGKMALGLRIVRSEDESRPGFARVVLVRMVVIGVLGAISNALTPYLPIFPFLWVDALFVFRSDRRCLHDLIAQTQVVTGKPGRIDVHAFD